MIMQWDKNSDAYEAIEKVVLGKYANRGETIVVQLREKHLPNERWWTHTVLLLNDGEDWLNPKWIWETDWWEGEPYVELIAAAPVMDVDLDDKYKL